MIIPLPSLMDEECSNELIDHASQFDWIFRFLRCPNWNCECGLINFGRNKRCADQRCGKDRPPSYIEPSISD